MSVYYLVYGSHIRRGYIVHRRRHRHFAGISFEIDNAVRDRLFVRLFNTSACHCSNWNPSRGIGTVRTTTRVVTHSFVGHNRVDLSSFSYRFDFIRTALLDKKSQRKLMRFKKLNLRSAQTGRNQDWLWLSLDEPIGREWAQMNKTSVCQTVRAQKNRSGDFLVASASRERKSGRLEVMSSLAVVLIGPALDRHLGHCPRKECLLHDDQ